MSLTVDRNNDVDAVRRSLDAWKEVLVAVKKVVDWEQNFYPGVIVGVITFKFLMWWYMDPTMVVATCMTILTFLLADQLLPFIAPKIFPMDHWGRDEENDFSAVCEALVDVKYSAKAFFAASLQLKSERPRVYLVVAVVVLLLCAWIGSALGDMTVWYFCVVFASLYPGAKKHGIIDAYFSGIFAKLQDVLFKKSN